MRNIFFAVLIVVGLGTISYSTKNEVEVDKSGRIPIVKVSNPEFKTMCRYLAHKLEPREGTSRIGLRPNVLDNDGGVVQNWFASTKDKEIQVLSSELPDVLRTIHVDTANKILMGACHLHDTFFYSAHDIILVTETNEEANLLAEALRR